MDTYDPRVCPDEVAALDATVTEADWPLVQRLWKVGLTNRGIYSLLRLRGLYRKRAPETDGLDADPHALFARWLVTHGRLNEQLDHA
jgi:hypothetical protein